MMAKGRAVRVKKKDAQKAKQKLKDFGALDPKRALRRNGEYVYLPILEGGETAGYETVEAVLEERRKKKSFQELALERFGNRAEKKGAAKSPKAAGEGLFSSYDMVGDIAILQIPKGLEKHETEIGELLLESEKRARVVLKKAGGRAGKYRVTGLKHLAGEARTTTLYVENGVRMKLDIAKVYFSPRLSHERKRIAGQVGEGERVLVLFAGVGPFALVIGRENPSAEVVGVELNPDAVSYFRENILLNRLENVEAVPGDVEEIVPERYAGWARRIVMPLPMGAEEYLWCAFAAAKKGCIVHFYRMAGKDEGAGEVKRRIEEAGEKAGRKVEFLFERAVRPYSASTVQYVIDFRVL